MEAVLAAKSTNVRSTAATRLLRSGFAAAAAVTPSVAAWAGERLFCWPPRRHPAPHQRTVLAAGEPFVVPVHSNRLRAWRFGAGPTVLLVHGWGGHSGQFVGLVPALVAAGCAAVVFDAPAHGASTGRFASGIAFADAVSTVATRVGARAVVGHSMGAAALGWAMANGLELDAAVMLAPPRHVGRFFRLFCAALALTPALEDAIRDRILGRHGVTPEEFDICRRVGAGRTPLLVIHDRDDRSVPWTDGRAIAEAWPCASLSITEGLGHTGILRDASVNDSVTSFVRNHLARCSACGRLADSAPDGRAPFCEQCALERELFEPASRA